MTVLLAGAAVATQLRGTRGDARMDILGYGGEGITAYLRRTRCPGCEGRGSVPYDGPAARCLFSRRPIVRTTCLACGGTGRST